MKATYHALDGVELKAAILKRVEAGLGQALDCRAFRSYPLVKWEIVIDVTPYEHAGADFVDGELVPRQPVELPKDTFKLAGYDFLKVDEDAVRARHASGIVGMEVDPQDVREQIGLGRLVTRIEEGQHVDTYAPLPEAPAVTVEGTKPIVIGKDPVPAPAVVVPPDAEAVAKQEEADWTEPKSDPDFNEAISTGEVLKGRVTVVGSGRERRGRR